jgi:hypothetical protein
MAADPHTTDIEARLRSVSASRDSLCSEAADEIERLRKGLNEVRDFLQNPGWGTWPYMEGCGVYEDKEAALFNIKYALGEES